jgi:hypothetical protein
MKKGKTEFFIHKIHEQKKKEKQKILIQSMSKKESFQEKKNEKKYLIKSKSRSCIKEFYGGVWLGGGFLISDNLAAFFGYFDESEEYYTLEILVKTKYYKTF